MRNFIIFFLVAVFCHEVGAQSALLPNKSLTEYYLRRAEIRSGILKNKIHFDAGTVFRKDAAAYMNLDLDQLVYDGDSANYHYVLKELSGWTGKKSIKSKKKVLGVFYEQPANFYQVHTKEFKLSVNPVVLYTRGYEKDYPIDGGIFKNERGVELRGSINKKVGFYTYITDNQARYPSYVIDYIGALGRLPGEGNFKSFNEGKGYDYYTARGHVTFTAAEYIRFSFGHNRNFIGNGTRSLILSDFAKDYLSLKIDTRIWRFNYQNIFAEMIDLQAYQRADPRPKVYPKKYFIGHYLSLDLLKNLNIGFYEGVVTHDNDGTGRGFDLNYLNPIIFYRAVEHNTGNSPDNMMVAANVNYLPTKGLSLYAQYMLDEFLFLEVFSRDKWWANKYGLQIGMHVVDLLEIKNLDFRLEYNMVRPYTYSHLETGNNFTHQNQPLAHPLGANFKEIIGEVTYTPHPKVFTKFRFTYSTQGLDSGGYHFGANIYEPYTNRPWDYNVEAGQGVRSDITSVEFNMSYMFRHNLFFDFSMMLRSYKTDFVQLERDDLLFNIGIRWNAIPKNLHF